MNILIIKLSSLGDVIHNLPIVWDIRQKYPDARLDWVVEEAYVALLEPLKSKDGFRGIDHIIPIAMRRWKKHLLNRQTRHEAQAFYQTLRAVTYDVVIETQGLIKAACLTRLAKRQPNAVIAGLANATEDSGYEPLVRWFYQKKVSVPLRCHAVSRSRLVAAAAINETLTDDALARPKFYPQDFVARLQSIKPQFEQPYAIFFHATARAAKKWPEQDWISLGQKLAGQGKQIVLPWGNALEKADSERMAEMIPNTIVPPALSIHDWFAAIAAADVVVGVDTGLTHLAAVMCKPTIEIYCDSPRWKTQGFWSAHIKNLGDTQDLPPITLIMEALNNLQN